MGFLEHGVDDLPGFVELVDDGLTGREGVRTLGE